jgi:hypothetical protein
VLRPGPGREGSFAQKDIDYPSRDHHAVGRLRCRVTTNQAIILALWDEDTLDAGILGFLCEFCQPRET